jgi:hypothetical protein
MAWDVEFTDEFGVWWAELTESEQEDVAAVVEILEQKGPQLRRPYSGFIESSKHSNMKELVIQHAGRPYRVLYAFDPRRNAILLLGGDKTGNANWYQENVPKADKIYDAHLAALKKEGQL